MNTQPPLQTQTSITRSIWAGVYLITQGVPLLELRPEGNRRIFVFDNTGKQAEISLDTFYTDNPTVPVHSLSDTYRELLAQVHASRQLPENKE